MIADQLILMGTTGTPGADRTSWVFSSIAAIVIALLLARWTWILFAPNTLVALAPQAEKTGTASAELFGSFAISGVSEGPVAPLSNLHLIGVFSGKRGFAVFRLDDKRQLGVAVGDEISKGIRLTEVAADYALLELNGTQQRVELENKVANNPNQVTQSRSLSSSPNTEQIIKGWNEANRATQKAAEISNAHR